MKTITFNKLVLFGAIGVSTICAVEAQDAVNSNAPKVLYTFSCTTTPDLTDDQIVTRNLAIMLPDVDVTNITDRSQLLAMVKEEITRLASTVPDLKTLSSISKNWMMYQINNSLQDEIVKVDRELDQFSSSTSPLTDDEINHVNQLKETQNLLKIQLEDSSFIQRQASLETSRLFMVFAQLKNKYAVLNSAKKFDNELTAQDLAEFSTSLSNPTQEDLSLADCPSFSDQVVLESKNTISTVDDFVSIACAIMLLQTYQSAKEDIQWTEEILQAHSWTEESQAALNKTLAAYKLNLNDIQGLQLKASELCLRTLKYSLVINDMFTTKNLSFAQISQQLYPISQQFCYSKRTVIQPALNQDGSFIMSQPIEK